MLVLKRTKGESILVGDDIEICVLSLNGKEARIGINAPRSVSVDRKEMRARKRVDPPTEIDTPAQGVSDESAE